MLSRIEALSCITSKIGDSPLIATCGLTSRELASLGDKQNYLYVLNSMGLAGPIGLGLALGLDGRSNGQVFVIEGDGGLLMGINFLATVAYVRPRGLVCIVLDNGSHCSTGAQPTAASRIDLGTIAEGFSLNVLRAANRRQLEDALDAIKKSMEASFLHVRISTKSAPKIPYLQRDPSVISKLFGDYMHDYVANH